MSYAQVIREAAKAAAALKRSVRNGLLFEIHSSEILTSLEITEIPQK
jgi:hypothetical protein